MQLLYKQKFGYYNYGYVAAGILAYAKIRVKSYMYAIMKPQAKACGYGLVATLFLLFAHGF